MGVCARSSAADHARSSGKAPPCDFPPPSFVMETLLLLRIAALASLASLGWALSEDELLLLSPEELCKDRLSEEYFRLKADYDGGDCRDVVRCDRAGAAGTIRLAAVRCPAGLAFDIYRQTCDWKAKVDNCDQLSKPRKALPNLRTDEPVCPQDELQCGNGQCINKALFCDEQVDCQDGSDENACGVSQDPNRAPECDTGACLLPDCFCSPDGTRIPGNINPDQVPQMITITFNGAINSDNI